MRPLSQPRAALSALLAAALLLAACAAPQASGFTALTTDRTIVQLAEGLALSVSPAALTPDFEVNLQAWSDAQLTAESAQGPAAAAFAARPPALTLASSIFTLEARGTRPAQVFLSVITPSAADAAEFDLYGWDGQAWSFLPSEPKGGQRVAAVAALPQAVALFRSVPPSPLAWVRLAPGDTLPVGAPVDALLLGGVTLNPNGSLGGVLPNLPPGLAAPLYPIIQADGAQIAAALADPAARAAQIQLLAQLAAGGNFAGLALDYRGLPAAAAADFTAFVGALHTQLKAQNHALLVFVDLGDPATGVPASAVDLPALGAAADAVLARLPARPDSLGDGSAELLLRQAANRVERGKLRAVTSALALVGDVQPPRGLGQTEALAALGNAQASGWADTQYVNQPVTVTLSGGYQTA
ncbi:MAG: hypothetical protein JNK29_13100, partial [Anaerolineales bacterium]|nr:hypothetical protein [Anaerolineales bacterium]